LVVFLIWVSWNSLPWAWWFSFLLPSDALSPGLPWVPYFEEYFES
jgi:hypothetical protein